MNMKEMAADLEFYAKLAEQFREIQELLSKLPGVNPLAYERHIAGQRAFEDCMRKLNALAVQLRDDPYDESELKKARVELARAFRRMRRIEVQYLPTRAVETLLELKADLTSSTKSAKADHQARLKTANERRKAGVVAGVRLPARRREVLGYLIEGRSDREIIATMGIVDGTLATHIHRLFNDFQVKSRDDLFIAATGG